MKIKLTVVALTLLSGLALTSVAMGQDRLLLAKAEQITGDRFKVAIRTSKGANVYAVNRPSAAVLNAIDKGLTDLFAVSRKNGYSRRLNYSD
jgi:hypothetical protein